MDEQKTRDWREGQGLSRRGVLAGVAGAALVAVISPRGWALQQALDVKREEWGKTAEGVAVDLFTLSNGVIEAKVTSYGATLTTVKAPDRNGKSDIVTLYLDTLADYLAGHPLFGSTVGRFANRIGGARFAIDGKEYDVVKNSGQHHIHGGNREGFARVVWKGEVVKDADWVGVKLTHTSADGEAGFPGTVQVGTTYKLTRDNRLIQEYSASTDKPTHVNLTNHAYWNLAGAGSGDVLGHLLTIDADKYLATDNAKIPSGEMKDVTGTVMDFRKLVAVGARIKEVEGQNYDHCYVLNKPGGQRLSLAARVVDPASGRVMEVSTTQPGVQLYTARGLNNRLKGGGKAYGPYHGLCLETQHYPDAPNKPSFPTTLLRPGETLNEVTIHRFDVQQS